MKWALFETESTIIITMLNSADSENSTMKLTLMVFYLAFGTDSGCSSPRDK